MKILKRAGPETDSCETPVLTLQHELKDESTVVLCSWLVENLIILIVDSLSFIYAITL